MAYDSENETCFEERIVTNDLRAVAAPKDAILGQLQHHGFPESDIFAVKLALEEALTNAVKHGNAGDPQKKVTVRYRVTPDKVEIMVRDEGRGFFPEEVPDCTCPERLPVPSGRGILLMKSYMDKICYRDKGREVYFMKRRSGPARSGGGGGRETRENIRRTTYFSGRVQGVGFRFNAESIASRFTVTGYVRNLPDGRVELVAEGEHAEVDRFQKAVEESMNGYIKSTHACDGPASGEFLSFRITR